MAFKFKLFNHLNLQGCTACAALCYRILSIDRKPTNFAPRGTSTSSASTSTSTSTASTSTTSTSTSTSTSASTSTSTGIPIAHSWYDSNLGSER